MYLPEIFHSKYLACGRQPQKKKKKKTRHRRSLSPTHTILKEATTFRASQGVKEGLDLEQTSFERDPPKLIRTTSTHNS
jgi:hypothetical protein